MAEDEVQRCRSAFRLFIDYLQAFPHHQRHCGMILWQPDGKPQRGTDYTATALRHLQDGRLHLGLLPDEQRNDWDRGAVDACLKRFEPNFEVVAAAYEGLSAEDGRSGTARVTLRHKVCAEFTLTLRFVKKVVLASNHHVYLIDDDGLSTPVKKCKRIKLFDFPFVTNTVSLLPWLDQQEIKRRQRRAPKKAKKQ